MTGSWWKRATTLLCAILLSATLFFAWTSFNVTGQIRRTVEAENMNSVRLWAGDVESRTGAIHEHIHELLVTLHNSNELRTGTPVMNARTKRKIVEMMEEKLIVSTDADAFFVFDTENDYCLFSAKTSLDSRAAHALKDFFREYATLRETPFRDRKWSVIESGGAAYFSQCIRLGKYVVGAVSSLDYYHIDHKFSVLGEDLCFFLQTEDGCFFCGGDELPLDPDRKDYGLGSARSTVSAQIDTLDALATLSVRPLLSTNDKILLPVLLFLDSAVCVVLVSVLLMLLRRKVARPSTELIRANQALAQGNMEYRLEVQEAGSDEFEALYESFNAMAAQITKLRIESYDLRLQEDQNRLTMLRAQLRPHSFLNAVTTISNMTYIAEPEEVRSYIAAFAKFIRYMLNVNSDRVLLSEELSHIRNYLDMQEVRFPGSIRFEAECEEEAASCRIPFLILYTLVENSIKHAMTLYEALEIRVRCFRLQTEDFQGLCLIEEDSGEGFREDVIRQILAGDAVFTKEHLGLTNVRYTLHLAYCRNDLLRISNREEGGARVEIRIPDGEEGL